MSWTKKGKGIPGTDMRDFARFFKSDDDRRSQLSSTRVFRTLNFHKNQLSSTEQITMTMMQEDHDDEMMQDEHMGLSSAATTIDPSVVQSRIRQSASLQQEGAMEQDTTTTEQPVFAKLSAAQASGNKVEYRRIRCPPHRYTPLREHWEQMLTPLVEYLKLQVRFDKSDVLKTRIMCR
jgi:hypothetical protein